MKHKVNSWFSRIFHLGSHDTSSQCQLKVITGCSEGKGDTLRLGSTWDDSSRKLLANQHPPIWMEALSFLVKIAVGHRCVLFWGETQPICGTQDPIRFSKETPKIVCDWSHREEFTAASHDFFLIQEFRHWFYPAIFKRLHKKVGNNKNTPTANDEIWRVFQPLSYLFENYPKQLFLPHFRLSSSPIGFERAKKKDLQRPLIESNKSFAATSHLYQPRC